MSKRHLKFSATKAEPLVSLGQTLCSPHLMATPYLQCWGQGSLEASLTTPLPSRSTSKTPTSLLVLPLKYTQSQIHLIICMTTALLWTTSIPPQNYCNIRSSLPRVCSKASKAPEHVNLNSPLWPPLLSPSFTCTTPAPPVRSPLGAFHSLSSCLNNVPSSLTASPGPPSPLPAPTLSWFSFSNLFLLFSPSTYHLLTCLIL